MPVNQSFYTKTNILLTSFSVEKYQPKLKSVWNNFVATSKNATFLFHRDFMDYHQDRFEDYSLMVFKNERLIALLPANKVGNEIHSHEGLSYGGLLLLKNAKLNQVVEILDSIISFLKLNCFELLHVKMTSHINCEIASNELEYLMHNKGAELYRRDIEMVIDFSKELDIHKTKIKHYKKNENVGFNIILSNDISEFWTKVLEPKLEKKYGSKPVHNLLEIQMLKNKFEKNIHQFDIYFENEIVAGITIFETDTMVKSQYGATTEKGEKLRALEFLFITLINKYKKEGKKFFSMGTANDSNYLGYNESLLKQKEELGCSVFLQDFYTLKLK